MANFLGTNPVNNRILKIPKALTWVTAVDLAPQDLPKDGIVTEVTIRANMTATLTAAAYDDWFRRFLTNIKIVGDGSKPFLGMSGFQMSTMLSLWQEVVMGMPTLNGVNAGIALAAPDVGSTAFQSIFKFHPGSDPKDPFDTSVAIPAKALSTFQVALTTAAGSVVDGSGAITAGTFNFEVSEILEAPRVGMMIPQGSSSQPNIAGTYSDFSWKEDVPVGAWLRGILLCMRDETSGLGRRIDDQITEVSLDRTGRGDSIFRQGIAEIKAAMAARFRSSGIAGDVGPIGAIATTRPAPATALDMIPAGFVYIDLRPFGDPNYGINLIGVQKGSYQLGFTVGSYTGGETLSIYYDQVAPWSG